MKTFIFIITILMMAPAGATASEIEGILQSEKPETFMEGQKVYKQYCMACHAASNIMVSSPKFGDRKDWGARLIENKNLAKLVQSAVKGKNAMPKKGRCIKCNENQIRAGIVYMMRGEEIK